MSDRKEVKDDFKIIKDSPSSTFKGLYVDQLKDRTKHYRTRVKRMFSIFAAGTSVILFTYVLTLVTAVTLKDG